MAKKERLQFFNYLQWYFGIRIYVALVFTILVELLDRIRLTLFIPLLKIAGAPENAPQVTSKPHSNILSILCISDYLTYPRHVNLKFGYFGCSRDAYYLYKEQVDLVGGSGALWKFEENLLEKEGELSIAYQKYQALCLEK